MGVGRRHGGGIVPVGPVGVGVGVTREVGVGVKVTDGEIVGVSVKVGVGVKHTPLPVGHIMGAGVTNGKSTLPFPYNTSTSAGFVIG